MKREDRKGVPPPLEEVDVDEFDRVTGAGPFDFLTDFMGLGGLGFNGPSSFMGMPPGMTGGPQGFPFSMQAPNSADTIKAISALMDLSERRHGGGNGRNRR